MSRKFCSLHCLIILIGLAYSAVAQEPGLRVSPLESSVYLENAEVSDFIQDKTGFIWIASSDGLLRYDGYGFRVFRNIPGDSSSISGNNVLCLKEDSDGNIWAGLARGGVSCYERKTGRFRNYPFTRNLQPITASVSSLFFDSNGELWTGVGANGIVHLNKLTGEFQKFDLVTSETAPHLDNSIIDNYNAACGIWEDENGIFWICTSDDLYRFDPKTGIGEPQRAHKVKPGEYLRNQAYSLLPDGDLLWIGGWESGLRCFNRKTGEWKQFFYEAEAADNAVPNVISRIVAKSQDEIWVLAWQKGLGIFNKKTEKFFFYSEHPDIYPEVPLGTYHHFIEDAQHNIWIRVNSGIMRFQPKQGSFQVNRLQVTRRDNSGTFVVTCFLEDREGRYLFIGTHYSDGLILVDKKTGKHRVLNVDGHPPTEEERFINRIKQDNDGGIWVLTSKYILRFNPKTLQLEKPRQPPLYSTISTSNYYNDFDIDAGGKLWICTQFLGIIAYDPTTGKSRQFIADKKDPNAVSTNVIGSIQVDRVSRVWFGSRNETTYGYYLPGENRFEYLNADGHADTELYSLRLNSFYADKKGDIWASTESGLMHFDCSGQQPVLLHNYGLKDGLNSEHVIRSCLDNSGAVWGIARRKLFRIDPVSNRITEYGQEEGIDFPLVDTWLSMNGNMYLPTVNGYVRFHPDSLQVVKASNPLIITSFKVDDAEMIQGSEGTISEALIVPADSRFFSFEFACLDMSNGENLQYEYKLENYDKQWFRAGSSHFVNYTNIPAGRYNFQVKLQGADDSEAISVPLQVYEPFYRSIWFRIIVVLALLMLVAWFFLHRLAHDKQVRALKNKTQLLEKEKAVVNYESLKQQLNPHFLFNSLTSLGSLIQLDPKAASGFLDNLSKSYRYILKSSEQELVPLSEELKFTGAFVQLQKTRFQNGLEVNFQVQEEHLYKKIVPVTVQNLIENAIKHNIVDEDSPLIIEVFVSDDYLIVRNNLQKKKFVETSNRKGIVNLKSFYGYLSDRKILIEEDEQHYTIKIPLL
ncbi:MAG: two-component regulator propeller domain-containing protein [Saprospiraceae bacterium]